MKKHLKNKIVNILILIIICISISLFYKQNITNYKKHNEIKYSYIKHPENLPTKEMAIKTSFGFKNLKADIYWLEAIQYIGSNAIGSEYKKYLYTMLDTITELNPYFEHPYLIGELLLPGINQRYEKLSEKEIQKNNKQAEKLGLKGIKNFCNSNIIQNIKNENNLNKIWLEDKYQNPCKKSNISYYLGYIYYEYLKDPITASLYYKISSANKDSLNGSKILAAIMQGKGGNREKSFFMFLNLAESIEKNNKICKKYSKTLNNIGYKLFISKQIKLDDTLLENINKTRNNVFGKFTNDQKGETKCDYYINKAIRELNLYFLEQANIKYKKEHDGISTKKPEELLKKGYIKYIPTDFQQLENQGIIYYYNDELKMYDYKMGIY